MSPLIVPASTFLLAWAGSQFLGAPPAAPDVSAYISVGGTLASVGATMLGFMLASLAVLASINQTHLVIMMRKTGHYADLLKTVLYACMLFLLCTAFGFALVFGFQPVAWARTVAVALHLAAAASLLDVGRKFWLVLGHLNSN